eukprot:10634-Eustigmatos_ZCMA.PRE.1
MAGRAGASAMRRAIPEIVILTTTHDATRSRWSCRVRRGDPDRPDDRGRAGSSTAHDGPTAETDELSGS